MRLTPADFCADLSDSDLEELESDLASAIVIPPPAGSGWDFALRFGPGARPLQAAGQWFEFTPEEAELLSPSCRARSFEVASIGFSFGEHDWTEYRLVEYLPSRTVRL
jgi:hypothetical protein